jgi:ABC-type transporter Mla subunit MlaD
VDDDLNDRLLALHDAYAAAVNAALDENREELVRELADEFSSVALELMSDSERAA